MSAGKKPVAVVGSINIDLVANTERIPVEGETVLGSGFQIHPGGKGANQAVAVARLGYPVRMIGRLGNDAFGEQLRSHLQRAHEFYEKYGGRAVILARFVPIVRTFCPPVSGAAKMPYPRYVMFDIVGGIAWVSATVLGGYYLGRTVPNISSKIHYVIIIVAVVSILPAIIGVLRGRKAIESPESSSSAGK